MGAVVAVGASLPAPTLLALPYPASMSEEADLQTFNFGQLGQTLGRFTTFITSP